MRRLFKGLSRVFVWARDKFGGGRPHRQVAIIGVTRAAQEQVYNAMFHSEECDTMIIATDNADVTSAVTSEKAGAQSIPEAISAVRLGRTGRRRPRRWNIYCPSKIHAQEDTPSTWKTESDFVVVAWPADCISTEDSKLQDQRFKITGSIGAARASGRLRGVAVVVVDLQHKHGLCDLNQQMLALADGKPFADEIRRSIDAAAGIAGDGLADPRWAAFLRNELCAPGPFIKGVESFRRMLNNNCPVFFLPEGQERTWGLHSLLEWISHGKYTKPVRFCRIAKILCIATLCVFCGSLLYAISLPATDPLVFDDFQTSDPAQISAALDECVGRYDNVLLPSIIHRSRFSPTREKLRMISIVSMHLAKLKMLTAAKSRLLNEVSETSPDFPDSHYQALSSLGREIHDDLTLSLGDFPPDSLISLALRAENTFRGRLRLLLAILACSQRTIIASDSGWVIGKPRWNLDGHNSSLNQHLSQTLTDWYATGQFTEYFRQAVALSSDEQLAQLISPVTFNELLPSIDPVPLVSSIRPMPLDSLIRSSLLQALDEVLQLITLQHDDCIIVEAQGALALRQLREDISTALDLQPEMVIRFLRFGDTHWHIDVSRHQHVGYRPSRPVANQEGSFISLKHIAVGENLYLVLNPKTITHRVSTTEEIPCEPGAPLTFRLLTRKGQLTFPNGERVEYEVVRGWPAWGTASGN